MYLICKLLIKTLVTGILNFNDKTTTDTDKTTTGTNIFKGYQI